MDSIWLAAQYVMSAVVYDVGYGTRMIKARKNMVTVRRLAAMRKKNFVRHRSPKKYQGFEAQCNTVFKVYISVVGFSYIWYVLTILMLMAKEKFDYEFSSCCNLHLKFGKITFGFTLTEQWESGNYHVIFWSITPKAGFDRESVVQFLYIFSISVATTHLAIKFYKKMEKVNKNRAGLSLLNSAMYKISLYF